MSDPAYQDDQAAVIEFLSNPASHGLTTGSVECIETHCSMVFLTADRALKLKRAIRFSSLDYTTRALRRRACEAELALNRRTAPELYLGVRSINQGDDGGLAFDGPGPALDHVVIMRRFDAEDLFDRMAETGRLTAPLMRALGRTVARFHLAAEPRPLFGGVAAISGVIADNERELGLVAPALDGITVGELSRDTGAVLARVGPLLEQRRAAGMVRRCHGDLRLANICLWDGRPTLFDCIEFSEEIGCVDVLYDLAFLLMDLCMRGRGDLANVVFNAWADLWPETEGLRALPLFLSLRAATRSYALAGKSRRAANPRDAGGLLTEARRHVRASIDFQRARRPLLVALAGDDGPRRAEFAAMLATRLPPAPGARILCLDASAEAAWRESGGALAAGCSVVVTGRFASPEDRRRVSETARPTGVRVVRLHMGTFTGDRDWKPLDPAVDPETLVKTLLARWITDQDLTPVNAATAACVLIRGKWNADDDIG